MSGFGPPGTERTLRLWEEAHRRADREVTRRLNEVFAHFAENNYGLAEDHIRDLLDELRHDHGAQEFHPMFERHLSQLEGDPS